MRINILQIAQRPGSEPGRCFHFNIRLRGLNDAKDTTLPPKEYLLSERRPAQCSPDETLRALFEFVQTESPYS